MICPGRFDLKVGEQSVDIGNRYPLVSAIGNIPTTITLNWKPRFNSFRSIWDVMLSKPTWLRGKTTFCGAGVVVELAEVAIVDASRDLRD